VGLHVSFVVKTQFHHAPESHAYLSEVGETPRQSVYQALLVDQLSAGSRHQHLQADIEARHRFTCSEIDSFSAFVDSS
jgi:hypothetical protein